MEDAINLFNSFDGAASVGHALERFQGSRGVDVEETQYAANVSALWTENPARYWKMEPIQACFSMLSRAKAVTFRRSASERDPDFVENVQKWFAGSVRSKGFDISLDTPPPPMFTPFRIGQLVVENRVAVSPMNMYSAEPGGVRGDFHLVHLGKLAMGGAEFSCSRNDGCLRAREERIPGCPGIYSEEQVAAWRRISRFMKRESHAKFCLQLGHSEDGNKKRGWEGMDRPLDQDN